MSENSQGGYLSEGYIIASSLSLKMLTMSEDSAASAFTGPFFFFGPLIDVLELKV